MVGCRKERSISVVVVVVVGGGEYLIQFLFSRIHRSSKSI